MAVFFIICFVKKQREMGNDEQLIKKTLILSISVFFSSSYQRKLHSRFVWFHRGQRLTVLKAIKFSTQRSAKYFSYKVRFVSLTNVIN